MMHFSLLVFLILEKLHDCDHCRGDFLLANHVTHWEPITHCIQEKRNCGIKTAAPTSASFFEI